MADFLKIAILGAPGVGKTAIIQQFVWNQFAEDARVPHSGVYHPSVVLNDRIYHLVILDIPASLVFTDNQQEWIERWTETGHQGIQPAHAYILVYDICCFASFEYIKAVHQLIVAKRPPGSGKAPILIVGNKRDLQRRRVAPRHNVAALVKRTWKCGYIECSAKYNWHILLLFKELLKTTGCLASKGAHASACLQGGLRANRCIIL
ncbi:ras-like protein family member 10B [Stegostoma tigrinum]|uniref:ras-like protein family member 10B n=1 Tax=Stegostoma tigrinum TaxID=3053191 RepID=UPI00202AF6E7|nr:ras-like protein family member 10B [Stegostoma tigrinum]